MTLHYQQEVQKDSMNHELMFPQGPSRDAPTRPDIEMGITQPAQEAPEKHMEEFFKEVSLIKVNTGLPLSPLCCEQNGLSHSPLP